MSYIINKTDGSTLTEIVDGSIDQTATDLTLIGKNSSSYGTFVNENFVYLLENFANTTQPNYPQTGQLWFDTSENRMKVYDGSNFKVSGGTIVAKSAPSSISQGDIWIDSYRQQLYFNDGVSTVLAGPQYTSQQGISGIQTIDVVDINQNTHTVVLVYVARVLMGLYSKDTFTPLNPISGFTGEVQVGFNASSYSGFKIRATATQADALVDPTDGSLKTARDFIASNQDSSVLGTVTIQSANPLIIGPSSNTEFTFGSSIFNINSNILNQNFSLGLINANGLQSGLYVNATLERVGIYTNSPTATLDVNGDVVVQGDLTVNGSLTTINTTNLEIEDKLILLGNTASPSNSTANGGGITVAGGSGGNKSITWSSSTNSWLSSENWNIPTGKTYQINGFDVLSASTLGNSVLSSSLTTVGTLSILQVDYINVNNSTISYVNSGVSNGDITITPKGSGVVNVSSAKISNVANPSSDTDAANLITVNKLIQSASLAISLTVTGLTNPQIASTYLVKIFPVGEHQDGTNCRVVCNDTGVYTVRLFTLTTGSWVYQYNL